MFCGVCGAQQSADSKFCVNCGTPAATAPRARRVPPRHLVIAAAGLGGVLAIGAGVAVGLQVFGGEGGTTAGVSTTRQRQVVEPVTSQPTESWSWQAENEGGASVVADGDLVVVVDSMADQSSVVRLDADGNELWRAADAAWATAADESEGRVYIATEYEGPGVAALDADTGEEVWRDADRNFVENLEGGHVLLSEYSESSDASEIAVVDDSGSELWSAAFDNVGVRSDQVITLDDSQLSSRNAVSGDVSWELDTGLDLYETYGSLAVTEDIVVTSADDTVIGYDPESGEELWRENLGFGNGISVAVGGPGLVYTYESGDSEAYEDGEVVFLGVDGILDRRAMDPDECCYSGFGFNQDGQDYFAASDEGIVYDEDLTPVARFDGTLVPTTSGFYEARSGELSYHLIDGTETWARQVGDPDSYVEVIPLDGQVLVAEGDTITAYE